jgi:amidase
VCLRGTRHRRQNAGLLAQIMSVQGVICREVRDVRAGMQALIKYDPRDPWMVPMGWDSPRPEGKIKVAFTRNTYEFDLHPAVEKALDTARDCLVDAGYEVVEADMPELREAGRDGGKALFGEVNALLRGEIDKHGTDELKKIFADYDAYYQPPEGTDLLLLMAKRNHYHRQFNLFFEEYPLVLTPFLPTPPTIGTGMRKAWKASSKHSVPGCTPWPSTIPAFRQATFRPTTMMACPWACRSSVPASAKT